MDLDFPPLPHRSVRRHRALWPMVVRDMLLTLLMTALVWWLLKDISKLWVMQLNFWMRKTGLVGYADVTALEFAWIPHFVVTTPTLLPSAAMWWATALVCALLWGCSLRLSPNRLPLIYLLRLLVLVQLSSLVFFYVWADSLPTTVAHFLTDIFRQSAGLMLLIPILFAIILHLFYLPWWIKYGATATALLFVALFVPLQAACVAWILQMGSILFMPTLYLFCGLLLQVVALMGIYSFAVSFLPSDRVLSELGVLR
jgi:hypothetical protein